MFAALIISLDVEKRCVVFFVVVFFGLWRGTPAICGECEGAGSEVWMLKIQLANLLMYLRALMQLKVFSGGTGVGHYLTLSAFRGEKRASN